METTRTCLDCGAMLHGRTDKKFCDDQCRSHFNNQQNKATQLSMRYINAILRRNRAILAALNPGGKARSSREILLKRSFDFDYHTHIYQNRSGQTYFFCYEQGYLELEPGKFLLVKSAFNAYSPTA